MKHFSYVVLGSVLFLCLNSFTFAAKPKYPCNCAEVKIHCGTLNAKQCIKDGNPVEALNIINKSGKNWNIAMFNSIKERGCGIVAILASHPTLEVNKDGKNVPVSKPIKEHVKAIEEILKKVTSAFLSFPSTKSSGGTQTNHESNWEYRTSAINFPCKIGGEKEDFKPVEHAVITNNVNFIAAISNLAKNKEKLLFTKAEVEGKRCKNTSGSTKYVFAVVPFIENDFMMVDNHVPVGARQCLNVAGILHPQNAYRNISVLHTSNIFNKYPFGSRNKVKGIRGAVYGNLKTDYKAWDQLPEQVREITGILANITAPATKSVPGGTKVAYKEAYEGWHDLLATYYNGSCPTDKLRKQFPLVPYDLEDLLVQKFKPKDTKAKTPCGI